MLQLADFITNAHRMFDNHYITLMCVAAISIIPLYSPPGAPQLATKPTMNYHSDSQSFSFWSLKWTCPTIRLASKSENEMRNAKSEANPCYQRRPQITLHLSAKIAMENGEMGGLKGGNGDPSQSSEKTRLPISAL